MGYKLTYHAISKPDVGSFNKELNEYIDQGYCPFGGLSVASANIEDKLFNTYSLLLTKSVETEDTKLD